MSKMPSLMEMLKAGVHFGHQRSRWHPKMQPYIFGVRNGVHIIDLDKTQEELAKAILYVKNLTATGKVILFVGTKKQAREIIKTAAESCAMPYLNERWIGGLLTNFDEFKRRLKKYKSIKEMFATGEIEKYTKHEQTKFKKQLEKMEKHLGGLVTLEKLPDALYVADVRVEKTGITEARRMHVPLVAVCDSNVDPTKIDYPIPANDDAVHSIKMMAILIAQAAQDGIAEFEKNKVAMKDEHNKKPAYPMLDKETSEEKVVKPVADKTVKKERRVIKQQEAV